MLLCEDYDPTQGGCPISSAKFKNDIHYLHQDDLELLRDQTLRIRLASYRYKPEFTSDPTAQHLGFIIEMIRRAQRSIAHTTEWTSMAT